MTHCVACVALLCTVLPAQSDTAPLRADAKAALRRAGQFYAEKAASHGGYVWRYSADLSLREGEKEVSQATVWVQPPGTPSVGQVFLTAYQATDDEFYLQAALAAANALVQGQLRSGGWDYQIDFDPKDRTRWAYRVEPEKPNQRNVTTLDDDTTQSALRFLMEVDEATEFKHAAIHDSVQYALKSLLAAQYPNGAWPQRFSEPPDPKRYPVLKANYPDDWPREYPKEDYRDYYTFNDDTIADMIDTMLLAGQIYGESIYKQAAEKAGDFILLAQMPEPQPAWAQQYNSKMQPAWARRFEPPSITGGESQGILRTLIVLYHATGQEKYLEPIPRALEYLRGSKLPGGGLARFYELKTNRPLYFTREYELVYHDQDLPTHYGFKVDERLDRISQELERARERGPRKPNRERRRPTQPNRSLIENVQRVIGSLDDQGRWVQKGDLRHKDAAEDGPIVDSQTFVRNVRVLSEYLASKP